MHAMLPAATGRWRRRHCEPDRAGGGSGQSYLLNGRHVLCRPSGPSRSETRGSYAAASLGQAGAGAELAFPQKLRIRSKLHRTLMLRARNPNLASACADDTTQGRLLRGNKRLRPCQGPVEAVPWLEEAVARQGKRKHAAEGAACLWMQRVGPV